MLSTKMTKALNEQIAMEANASFLYLSMASWCDSQGLGGSSQFMFRQSAEEQVHMMRIFNYILELDGRAFAPAVAEVPKDFDNITSMFKLVYSHEQKVTASINKLVDLALAEKDHVTYNFLQWYVEEQKEEEVLMRNILDRIKLIGDGPQSLYYIDNEITVINNQAIKEAGNQAG